MARCTIMEIAWTRLDQDRSLEIELLACEGASVLIEVWLDAKFAIILSGLFSAEEHGFIDFGFLRFLKLFNRGRRRLSPGQFQNTVQNIIWNIFCESHCDGEWWTRSWLIY